jgi:hypothetical protein
VAFPCVTEPYGVTQFVPEYTERQGVATSTLGRIGQSSTSIYSHPSKSPRAEESGLRAREPDIADRQVRITLVREAHQHSDVHAVNDFPDRAGPCCPDAEQWCARSMQLCNHRLDGPQKLLTCDALAGKGS